jgi:hypothetical protein
MLNVWIEMLKSSFRYTPYFYWRIYNLHVLNSKHDISFNKTLGLNNIGFRECKTVTLKYIFIFSYYTAWIKVLNTAHKEILNILLFFANI